MNITHCINPIIGGSNIYIFKINEIVSLVEEVINDMPPKENNIIYDSIIGYDDFVKQIVFAIYYQMYLSDKKNTKKLIYYNKKIDDFRTREEIDSGELRDPQNVTSNFRYYMEYLGNYIADRAKLHGGDAEYHRRIKYTNWERTQNPTLDEEQYQQALKVYKHSELFDTLMKKSFRASKNVYRKKVINRLKLLSSLYEDIDREPSCFEKCVEYYQLEIGSRFETNYKIIKALTNVMKKNKKRKLDLRRSDVDLFKCFQIVNQFQYFKDNGDTYTVRLRTVQNQFILDIDRYIEQYLQNPRKLKWFNYELAMLSSIRKFLISHIMEIILSTDVEVEMDFAGADEYFKDFIGMGQHITVDKQWEKLNFKFFFDLYTDWETKNHINYLNKIGLYEWILCSSNERYDNIELDDLVTQKRNEGYNFSLT